MAAVTTMLTGGWAVASSCKVPLVATTSVAEEVEEDAVTCALARDVTTTS